VRIWLWRAPSETLAYCECYVPDPGGNLVLQGACP
jgi:hypothetical protein